MTMNTRRINGILFEKMFRNGLNNLRLHEAELNSLNVFPVADGDTGTNMRLTLENGLAVAKREKRVGVYLKELSGGMLLGARGNSGVILSQIFKGIAVALSKDQITSPGRFRNALIRGYRTAYDAVLRPVEGTILTVAREGVENIRSQVSRDITLEMFFNLYVAEMKRSLQRTPDLLSALKEANVVDSGALGYIYLVEGMQSYLYGDVISTKKKRAEVKETQDESDASGDVSGDGEERTSPDTSFFNENSSFEDGYCMEFLLQLMKDGKYLQTFRLDEFKKDLNNYGNSIVAVQEGSRVKVHIHTFTPAKVMIISQEFGEFVSFKLENMQLQHNEKLSKQIVTEHKPVFKIAAANGAGFEQQFRQFGCDVVIKSGPSMNTSANEFLEAINQADADRIVIFPNNSNSFGAAEQAVKLSGRDNITVIMTKDMVQGYFALAMDVADDDDLDYRLEQMKQGAESVVTLFGATATKDYSSAELSFHCGDEVALLGDQPICFSKDRLGAILDSIGKADQSEEHECVIIFKGKQVGSALSEELAGMIQKRYPRFEVSIIDGGQEVYTWLVGMV